MAYGRLLPHLLDVRGDTCTTAEFLIDKCSVGAMFWLSPSLTLLMLTVVPPISLGAVFYGRYLKKLSGRTQEALGDMSKVNTQSAALEHPAADHVDR
jgi:ABC-type bacteriocin/lantibiotic exporter with double-glycine peptidase domain